MLRRPSHAASTRNAPDAEDEPVVLLTTSAAQVLDELQRDDRSGRIRTVDTAQLIAERADLSGYPLAGPVSAGGACRLLPGMGGMVALSLARPDDWTLLPALFDGGGITPGNWDEVAARVRVASIDTLVDTGALLGLAIARADGPVIAPSQPYQLLASGPAATPQPGRRPRVLDMGALWAGPLCGHLLQLMGATVVKVESPRRPDGARCGSAPFYALLNQNKDCVAIDLGDAADRALLLALMGWADIVIESARPRALRHADIDAATLVKQRPGLLWIAISGHGRDAASEQRIGYGDDAAAAAGLCSALHRATGQWAFVEDAIADPLTGIHAAGLAWKGWRSGRGGLVALSLRDVAAWSLAEEGEAVSARLEQWYRQNSNGRRRSPLPARMVEAPPRAVGADMGRIADLIAAC